MEEFHWFYGQTVVNPLGLAMVVIMSISMLFLPRRFAIWPMAIIACFVAPAQRFYIFSFNFTFLRILILFGWIRLCIRGEFRFKWITLDRVFLAWAVVHGTANTVLNGLTPAAFVFSAGEAFDALGMYFLFRCLIRDWDDVHSIVKAFALLSITLIPFFAIEHSTGHNPFAFFGGVPAITFVRDGRLRCQGAFSHPIMAGTFWATLIPFFVAELWAKGLVRWFIQLAVFCALFIIILTASSGPIMAVFLGVAAAAFFPLRSWMRLVRWSILGLVVGLHMVMKAPVWDLLGRIDIAGGSTGWHRTLLITEWINHFSQWWFVGTVSTDNWGSADYAMVDITNQYVLEAIRGGLPTLVLFIALISYSFRDVGRLCRIVVNDKAKLAFAWALGVALFMHVTSFISVSYFGQIIMIWYLLLAMIASLTAYYANARLVPARKPAQVAARVSAMSRRPAVNRVRSEQFSAVGTSAPASREGPSV
jgi:hypothetical protein